MTVSTLARPLHLASMLSAVLITLGTASPTFAQSEGVRVGLDGYCPVCIVEARKWERGSTAHQSSYDGVTYRFPNAAIKAKFDASPARYVPVLNGDCIVCYAKMGKRVPGQLRFGTLYKQRLYLFPSDRERQVFMKNAEEYVNADLAANGECVVCRKMAGKHVPGSADHTEIHGGLRYQFPSAREAKVFRDAPNQFVGLANFEGNAEAAANEKPQANSTVSFTGRGGCAACEHGVTPIGSPDQLGLAVNTKDGRVIVVEEAHRKYPKLYTDRFEGQSLRVRGMIIKTKGNVSWLKPTALALNN